MKKVIFLIVLVFTSAVGAYDKNPDEEEHASFKDDVTGKMMTSKEFMRVIQERKEAKIKKCANKYNGKKWQYFASDYGHEVSMESVILPFVLSWGYRDPGEYNRKPPKKWKQFIESIDFCTSVVLLYFAFNPDEKVIDLTSEEVKEYEVVSYMENLKVMHEYWYKNYHMLKNL